MENLRLYHLIKFLSLFTLLLCLSLLEIFSLHAGTVTIVRDQEKVFEGKDLQAAINEAQLGDTLLLRGEFSTKGVPFRINKSLDLIKDPDSTNTVKLRGGAPEEGLASGVMVISGQGTYVKLSDLTIKDGLLNGMGMGAGILNEGARLKLTNVTIIQNNQAFRGGGIANVGGIIKLINCDIEANTARFGGGISNFEGDIILHNCKIEINLASENGGGIWSDGGSTRSTVDMANSLMSQNRANQAGAAIYNGLNSKVAIYKNSKVNQNFMFTAGNGGGIYNTGVAFFKNIIIKHNGCVGGKGGGIFNDLQGILTVEDVEITNNGIVDNSNEFRPQQGGGLYNIGQANLFGRTVITDNHALPKLQGGAGGGIFSSLEELFIGPSIVIQSNHPDNLASPKN